MLNCSGWPRERGLLDAFIIRSLLLPSVSDLGGALGRLQRGSDRLPHLRIDRAETLVPAILGSLFRRRCGPVDTA